MIKKVYLDIETGPLPPEKREFTKPDFDTMSFKGNPKDPEKKEAQYDKAVESWENGDKAALDALTGEILLIGWCENDGEYSRMEDPEKDLVYLDNFWKHLNGIFSTEGIQITGHNILNFDIPFLVRRSLINGIQVPGWVMKDVGKYTPDFFVDTMRFWQFGDKKLYTKLEVLCGAFDVTVKDSDVTGADFYKWFIRDREKAIEYNRQDVEAVRELWAKMGKV